MKKYLVVVCAIILIVATSVTAFASSMVVEDVVASILNAQFSSQNCTLREVPSSKPYLSTSMVDKAGNYVTQKTTYDLLFALYETLTLRGVSVVHNEITPGVVKWYEYGDYCWIVFTSDSSALWHAGDSFVVANFSGKILYCDAPQEEEGDGYTLSPIAGASGYYMTTRPVNTVGNGYLGDLQVPYDNITSIYNYVDSALSHSYVYPVIHFVNGESRYYIYATYIATGGSYYICNNAGQLYYAVKDTGTTTPDSGGGSSFDATEIITALNSVYSAVTNVGSKIANMHTSLNGIGTAIGHQLDMSMINMTSGFEGVNGRLDTLVSYFEDLSGLFPVEQTITLSGTDTRVAWDAADRVTDVKLSGVNSDLIVKEHAGALVDESGYEKVTINEAEYSLYNDNNGYRRIKTDNEYPHTGPVIPDDTLFYFPFEDTLASTFGDFTLTSSGSVQYSSGISGQAFLFDGSSNLSFDGIGVPSSFNNAFTFSYWFYPTSWPSDTTSGYRVAIGDGNYNSYIAMRINPSGKVQYYLGGSAGSLNYEGGSLNLNSWNHVALTYSNSTFYLFANGNLEYTYDFNSSVSVGSGINVNGTLGYISNGCRIDDLLFVNGTALWTTSFNPDQSAIFSDVVSDYFLPCSSQNITLNFYDSSGEQQMEHRWNKYTVNTSRLPNGYTEVEYIRSDGSQYVNSGFRPNQDTRVVMDVDTGQSWSTEFAGLLGSGSTGAGGSSDKFLTYLYKSISGIHDHYDGQTKNSSVVNMYGRHVFDKNKNVTSIDGTVVNEFTYSSFQQSSPLPILTCYDGGYVSSTALTLYSCQIYDNGKLVRDFVPCKNPSNAVGLYDLVNNQFYGNSGTGSFTAGNEVSNGSSIGQLVGVLASTNRDAYPNDSVLGEFYYEYIGSFTEYPYFSQTLIPTDVNGNPITMGRLEDDYSEIYRDVEMGLWLCHDVQTQNELVLSAENQAILNDTIYIRQTYTAHSPDTLTPDMMQSLLPIDGVAYLDIPDGGSITITYDHYAKWFRMMYLFMDKQNKLLSSMGGIEQTIVNIENTVVEIAPDNDAFNIFYIEKTDGTTESVGETATDAAIIVGDMLSVFYRLIFADGLANAEIIGEFEEVYTVSNTGVNVW